MIIDLKRLDTDSAYREDMRFRCFTDHFFLAEMMGFKQFVRALHGPAVDLYFPKNPKLPIEEQHPIKNRMHLDPRGTFKTTLGRVDTMQWVIAFPETITILNQSATQPLAREISKGVADYFWCPVGRRPSPLQRLFPELVVTKEPFSNGKERWDTNSHKTTDDPDEPTMIDIDSTLSYTSPQTQQSGWHPWVSNPDDMVETKNSGMHANPDIRQAVIDTYDTNKNTLRRGGYNNVRGTRYHPFELYGKILDTMDPSQWKTLIRSAITVRSGAKLVPGEFPPEEDVICHFEQLPQMDYKAMRQLFIENYEAYMCQQQNDPQGGNIPTFDDKMYTSCLIAPERIPVIDGETYICWRMPYGGKRQMVYAEGAAARLIDGKVYVIDCWQGNWIPSKLAERMVQAHKQHHAAYMMILDTPGSEFMRAHIRNEAARRNVSIRMQWMEWSEDDNTRAGNIKSLEPLMKVGRILFSTGMTKAMDCQKQFIHYGLVEEDGIIECVAQFAQLIPMSQLRANMEEEEIEWQRRRREDSLVSAFLNQQGMPEVDEQARRQAEAHIVAVNRAQSWLKPLPGGLDG